MDKTKMINILRGDVLYETSEAIQKRLDEIADYLQDSEHVVRCKDCKAWTRCEKDCFIGQCRYLRCVRVEDDFCSYGELRTDEP